jgi:hypothetical protein
MTQKLGRFLTTETAKQVRTGAAIRSFVDGLGGAATIMALPLSRFRTRYAGRGIEGDWAAVGSCIRRAAHKLSPNETAAAYPPDALRVAGKESWERIERALRLRA